MNQDLLSFKPRADLCEVAGCNARATTVIAVKAGHYGTIDLHLCEDCVCKFEKED
jgi:hypothetical protein